MSSSATIFYGAVVNPTSLDVYQTLPRCLLSVDAPGNIEWIVEDVEPYNLQNILASKGLVETEVFALKDGEFIIPGFVDTHTHAPQYPNAGTGGQYQLLDWLERVTFPTEAKFDNLKFARDTYESVVRRVIDAGTTTCCYYGTLHLEATQVLADIINAFGQRAFVGKCSMDRNSPLYYKEASSETSIHTVRELIAHIRAFPQLPTTSSHEPRVQPIITPRFAISCTEDLLTGLGRLAAEEPNIRIQTHISENPSEVEYTRSLFPSAPSYAGVYDAFGLLKNNTILAHAVHLSQEEIDLVKERDAGISHCPTSNFNLTSGVAPVGLFLDKGIKVGLGTDVSGGFSISILNAIQNASIASKVISIQDRAVSSSATTTTTTTTTTGFAHKPLPIATLLYLATAGGARVCGLDNQIGDFKVGKSFDALLVSVREEAGNPFVWGVRTGPSEVVGLGDKKDLLEGCLERFLFCGDDRNIRRVYVQGRLIGGKAFHSNDRL